jgi:DNA-binding MarR family transcriptional regulator
MLDSSNTLRADPESRISYLIWQTQHAIERRMDAALKPLSLTLTQVATLIHLQQMPGLSGAEIARRLLLTAQNTALILAQLEARGWVHRSPHPIHRAVIEAVLTEEGQRVLAQGIAAIVEVEAQVTAGLSAAELAGLAGALRLCRDNATAQR